MTIANNSSSASVAMKHWRAKVALGSSVSLSASPPPYFRH